MVACARICKISRVRSQGVPLRDNPTIGRPPPHVPHVNYTQCRLIPACTRQSGNNDTAASPSNPTLPTRHPVAQYTPFTANTWILTLSESSVKILCDPWLVGKLSFLEQAWFFSGELNNPRSGSLNLATLVEDVDIILLSQELDDHTHRPTLEKLPKHIPVVGNHESAEIAQSLGFTDITEVDHNQNISVLDGKMSIQALEGAAVGPPWAKRKNAYVLKEEETGLRVYYEPHANFNATSIRAASGVDIAITPTTSTYAFGYPLVSGMEGLPDLLKVLKPKVIVPLINNTSPSTGALTAAISSAGSNNGSEVESWLESQGVTGVKVAGPQEFGEPLNIFL